MYILDILHKNKCNFNHEITHKLIENGNTGFI